MEPQTSTPTSPKVKWGAIAGLLAAVLGAFLAALIADPSGLGFDLPTWAVFALVASGPVVVQALTAYAKRDPLRDAGWQVPADGDGEHRAGGFTRPV